MTYKEKKDWLERYSNHKKMIEGLKMDAQDWLDIATACGPIMGNEVHGSSDGQKMANAVSRSVDIQREIEAETEALERERTETLEAINKLKRWTQRIVLVDRYIACLNASGTADHIKRSEKYVHQKTAEAIKALEI